MASNDRIKGNSSDRITITLATAQRAWTRLELDHLSAFTQHKAFEKAA